MLGEHAVAFRDEFLETSADAALNEVEFVFAFAGNFREKGLERLLKQKSLRACVIAGYIRQELRQLFRDDQVEQICRVPQTAGVVRVGFHQKKAAVQNVAETIRHTCDEQFQERR